MKLVFKSKKELLIGGLADNKTIYDIAKKHNVSIEFIKKQLKIGIKIELEHTKDFKKAKEIVFDHLWEIKDYYTRLIKMEKESKEKMKGSCPLEKERKNKMCFSKEKMKGLTGQPKVAKVMKEFKEGKLKTSAGKTVTSRDQAIAMAMGEAGLSKSETGINIELNLLKAKAEIGAISTRKDGTKWKKISEGKWEKVKERTAKEIQEQKKTETEQTEQSKQQTENVYQQIDNLNEEQRKEIADMITQKKSSEEINQAVNDFENENLPKEKQKEKIILNLANKIANKKILQVIDKIKNTFASLVGGESEEAIKEAGQAGVAAIQTEKLKKSFKEIFG